MNNFLNEINKAGFAGEFLVQYDLIKRGIYSSQTHPLAPFDLCTHIGGIDIRIQVKAKSLDTNYEVLKIDYRKSHGERKYKRDDFDVLAVPDFVTNRVAYIPPSLWLNKTQITLWLRPPKSTSGFGKNKQPIMFDDYLEFPKLSEIGNRSITA
jgi:hypothetical protein